MHIYEAYEHESIRPCRQQEGCCPKDGCDRVGTQCVDITADIVLTPVTEVGEVTVSCQGVPNITCETNPDGTSCTVTMTQQVCISVPVNYGVAVTAGEPVIGCANNRCIGNGNC